MSIRTLGNIRLGLIASIGLTIGMLTGHAQGQNDDSNGNGFRLTSTTFANNTTLPISAILNIKGCSVGGGPGGNQSPELSWTGAPSDTRTFVVTLYDVTAAFTHWGMYNIGGQARGLPENAGVAGNPYGLQVVNDFFVFGGFGAEYDGPCPPANVPPNVHQYVFTVYALDVELSLPSSANFPANPDTLYQALIKAGREGHILGSASLTGLYSTTP